MVVNLRKCVFIGRFINQDFLAIRLQPICDYLGTEKIQKKQSQPGFCLRGKYLHLKIRVYGVLAKSPKIKISRSCTISLAVKYLASNQKSRVRLPHGAYHKTHAAINQDLSNKGFCQKNSCLALIRNKVSHFIPFLLILAGYFIQPSFMS